MYHNIGGIFGVVYLRDSSGDELHINGMHILKRGFTKMGVPVYVVKNRDQTGYIMNNAIIISLLDLGSLEEVSI